MHGVNNDFGPIRKSNVSVNADQIIKDIRNDHTQQTKLKAISILPHTTRRDRSNIKKIVKNVENSRFQLASVQKGIARNTDNLNMSFKQILTNKLYNTGNVNLPFKILKSEMDLNRELSTLILKHVKNIRILFVEGSDGIDHFIFNNVLTEISNNSKRLFISVIIFPDSAKDLKIVEYIKNAINVALPDNENLISRLFENLGNISNIEELILQVSGVLERLQVTDVFSKKFNDSLILFTQFSYPNRKTQKLVHHNNLPRTAIISMEYKRPSFTKRPYFYEIAGNQVKFIHEPYKIDLLDYKIIVHSLLLLPSNLTHIKFIAKWNALVGKVMIKPHTTNFQSLSAHYNRNLSPLMCRDELLITASNAADFDMVTKIFGD